MRRLGLIAGIVLAIVGIVLLAIGVKQVAPHSNAAKFDVIFDDARGLLPGQLVKVAGARAGEIDKVVVTANFRARVEASIERRFMPFHQDATCAIRPEGLIAENYVDCDPGAAGSPVLHGSGGFPPTVPVGHTTEPVSLLDLFNIFNVPTRDRFAAIIDELGIGTAAEGQNFNDIIRRANPALQYARSAIATLDAQQSQLETILDATNTIAAQAASHTAALQDFVDQAATASTTAADHSSALSQAVNRLPGLLAAAQPALTELNTVAVQGTPLVNQIHAAVPGINTVSEKLGPFVAVAKPGLAKLSKALKGAVPAVRETAPIVKTVHAYLIKSLPATRQIATVFENLQQHGFVENFLGLVYYLAALTARFDTIGHLGVAYAIYFDNGLCDDYASTPTAACSAKYSSTGAYTPARATRTRRRAGARATATAPAATTTTTGTTTSTTSGATTTPARGLAPIVKGITSTVGGLTSGASSAAQQTKQTLQGLLNFLIK